MIGKTLSHYEIIEKLGEGGMGVVYRAKDTRLLRSVALKILPQNLIVDENNRNQFLQEAQTASSLNHPNICTIHDINEESETNFIVMEYVSGKTLREMLYENGPMNENNVIEIAIKICDALKAVHEKRILHRDIKPENIMISKEGYLKVMDFGLAKLATDSAETVASIRLNKNFSVHEHLENKQYYKDVVLSTLSGFIGTVSYMSPEQALGKIVDNRSDIFSLGIVLYELLTGSRPFKGEYDDEILYQIITEPIEIKMTNEQHFSQTMKKVITRCLHKKPDDRYQSIPELLIELKQIKHLSETVITKSGGISTLIKEPERRQMTILFAEISNYDEIIGQIETEEASSIMNSFFEMLTLEVEKHGGKTDKIIGGTILNFFGAPGSSEDSHKDAVNSAIAIRNKMNQFEPESNLNISLELKIGINTGTVIVEPIDKNNYRVMGNTVSQASQLKDLAKSREIIVGSQTYKLTQGDYEFQKLEEITLKGMKEQLQIYKLLSLKEKIHRSKLGKDRKIYSVIVGREKKLAKLKLQLAKLLNGVGSIVNIVGEAGIGKSRLIAELRNDNDIEQVTFIEGRSLSIGRNLSFHPLIDILKYWAGVSEDDSEKDASHKVENLIREIYPGNSNEIFPFIGTMMGYELKGEYADRVKGIKGNSLEKLILKNLRDFLVHASSQRPIIFVMEDLHWADTTSIEFLELIFRLAESSPIMFINLLRPNYKETGERILTTVKQRYPDINNSILLKSLSDEQSDILINNLLKIEGISSNIKNLIIKRSGGNPFFIEEVVRSFIDEGVILLKDNNFIVTDKINSVIIPKTINEVILSRIDRLDEETKSLLKKASVIGRSFFYVIIAEVAKNIEDLDERLAYLKEIQLIREHKRMGEVEYLFKHALVHETVYESILIKKRKELHIKTAKAIESVFSDRLQKFYGVLSYHYSKGEDLARAEEYLIKAGEEALKSSASNEAINFFKDALELFIKKYETSVDSKRKTILEYNIAVALQNKGRYAESMKYFDSVQAYYGYPLPKNKFMLLIVSILGYLHLFVGVTFPSLKWNKPHNNDVIEKINFWSDFNNSISLTDPKRGFLEILNNWREFTNYDFSEFEGLKVNMLGTSALLSFAGLFSSISKKMLKLIQPKIENKNTPLLIWYRFAHQCNNWIRGYWKVEDEVSYDPNLVNYGSSIGEATFTSLYINQHNLTKIERGEFDKVQEMLGKISEMGEVYENEYAKCLKNNTQTKLFMKARRISETIQQVDNCIELAFKLKDKLTEFALLSYKARVLIYSGKVDEAEKSIKNVELMKSEVKIPWYLTDYLTSQFNLDIYNLEKAVQDKNKSDFLEYRKKTIKNGKEAYKNSKRYAGDRIEIYRLMGTYYWFINKQKKASKWWEKSIKIAEESGGKLELSRTFMEVGKRLTEKKSKFTELNGVTAEVYLEKARSLFKEMDLQWDLEQLAK